MAASGFNAEASDADLVASARAGDDRAFDALFQRHYGRIVNFAVRLQGNMDEAEDIAQTAFVRAHASLRSIRDGQALLAWLYRTVVNLVRDRAKSARRKPLMSFGDMRQSGDDPEPTLNEPATRALDPAGIAMSAARDEALGKAIADLPLDFREPLVMHHLEHMAVEDIAGVLGKPIGTVKSRLSRARSRLREALLAWYED